MASKLYNELLAAIYCFKMRKSKNHKFKAIVVGCDRSFLRKEVADLLGISQSYISKLEKKTIKRLKSEINRMM